MLTHWQMQLSPVGMRMKPFSSQQWTVSSGTLDYVDVIAGGFDGSLQSSGEIEVEIQAITGATNELGFNRMSARGV